MQESSVDKINLLMSDFLDYASIKSGKFKINNGSMNIRDTVQKVMKIHKKQAQGTGIRFSVNFVNIAEAEDSLSQRQMYSPNIMADEQRIMQVLHNLQTNALKFTELGKVVIIVKIFKKEDEQFLEIAVVDSGIGIKEADQEKLFKLFGMSGQNFEKSSNGIGFGLLASKHLVDQLGGELSFVSKPNEGSTFRFTVKLHQHQPSYRSV